MRKFRRITLIRLIHEFEDVDAMKALLRKSGKAPRTEIVSITIEDVALKTQQRFRMTKRRVRIT